MSIQNQQSSEGAGTDMVTGQYCWSLQPGSTLLLRLSTPSTAAMLARWDLFCRQTLPKAHRKPVMLAHSFRQSCHNTTVQQNSVTVTQIDRRQLDG